MADEKKKPEDEKSLAPKLVSSDTGKPSKGLAVAPEMVKPSQPPAEDVAAPQIAPEPQQEPSGLQAATEMTPQPADPHLAGSSVPVGQEAHGKEHYDAGLRNFGEKKAALSSASLRSPFEFKDPTDYTKYLGTIQQAEGRLQAEEAHFKQSHPWGSIDSAHPGIGGKIGHAFGTIGNIAGQAVAPGLMPIVPGSQANLAAKAAGGEREQAAGEEAAGKAATTAATEAEVPLREAEASKFGQEEKNLEEPPDKTPTTPEGLTLHDLMTGDNGKPRINPDTQKPYSYLEAYEAAEAVKPKPTKTGTPEQQYIEDFLRKNPQGTLSDAVRAYAKDSQRPERGGTNDVRGDKSYQLQSTRLDKVRAPIEQLQGRLTRLQDTLNQHNPQADALVAPELLTVMAGGQGSGLRMNEAEIARIVGGRSVWENLKGSIQHWSTDPASARSITPDQDKMIRALVDTVHQKLVAKQQIIDKAEEDLLNSDNPHDHRQVVINARKQVDAIDAGEAHQSEMVRARDPQGNLHEAPKGTPLPAGWKAE